MTKIDKVLKRLSDLYEFNRKIKGYVLKKRKRADKAIQPTRNARG
jgi:hypothetical protein